MSKSNPPTAGAPDERIPPNAPGRLLVVEALARVEGEGALRVVVEGDGVTEVALRIYEPPRFFEAFLRGRHAFETPDITARICGICPIAYQMSACHAVEDACGVRVDGALRDLRRLIYCGEWIESHTLHIAMLHAPDFLGASSVVELAERDPAAVERCLRLKRAGNHIVSLVGGREIHPINVKVGGFYRAPTRSQLMPLVEELKWARDAAIETVDWVAGFDFPDLERDWELVALRHPDEYPMNEGRIASTRGLDVDVHDFDAHFAEEHVAWSNALHCRRTDGRPYLTGPLARYALNFDRLGPLAQQAARQAGLGPVCRNPFQSIIVRAVEVLYACDEALAILDRYAPPRAAALPIEPCAATGWAATEAPRGTLIHTYTINGEGLIEQARIIPPTSQNQASIEDDLRQLLSTRLHLDDAALTSQCEHSIRNHDPCISCATHFLRLEVERR